MTASHGTKALVASAAVFTLLLGACGASDDDETTTPTAAATETNQPAEAPSTPATEEPQLEESPATEETPAPEPSSTRAPVPTGPLEGEELNAAGVAWFESFCGGVGEISALAGPDTMGMEKDEVIQTVVATYEDIAGVFAQTSEQLGGMDSAMNFENAEGFTKEARDTMDEVSGLYQQGAETVATGSYESEPVLVNELTRIEASVVSAGGSDLALTNLDQSVLDAVAAQAPTCSTL